MNGDPGNSALRSSLFDRRQHIILFVVVSQSGAMHHTINRRIKIFPVYKASRELHVSSPISPSGVRPYRLWKLITAFSVTGRIPRRGSRVRCGQPRNMIE